MLKSAISSNLYAFNSVKSIAYEQATRGITPPILPPTPATVPEVSA